MREITQAILNSPVPVIGYVAPGGARAASAGAFVLLSCPVAAMAPGTNVGASTPVGVSGVVEIHKVTQDATASIRSIAETYGRNADVAASFVTDAKSISADEALKDRVIDLVEPSTSQLLTDLAGTTVQLGDGSHVALPADLASLQISDSNIAPVIGLLHDLLDPNLAFIFFWLGLGLVVLELIVPGHLVSGTVGLILLILAFVSFGVLPVRLVGILLLAVSVVFFVLEVKAPGLGIWSVLGLAALVVGGLFLYNGSGGVRVSPWVIAPVAAGAMLFFGIATSTLIAVRRMAPVTGAASVVGREGVVLGAGVGATGVVRVASEEWRAVSPSGPLAEGTRVRVTALDGLVLTVEPIEAEHAPVAGVAPGSEGGQSQ